MDVLQDEVESLEAILMEDVLICRNPETGTPETIETTIFPEITDDADKQYVCVTLQVVPSSKYPDISPQFKLMKPRGLDDFRLNEIKAACMEKLKETIGYPVVFELIELIRAHLTGSNLPSGQCVVCLYGFMEGDDFTKTECFHYLHSYCLARHLIASRRNFQEELDKLPAWLKKTADPFQAACPVCRESIKDDSESLKCALPPAELQNAPEFKLTDDLKDLQKKMTNLFLHQKSRGAIIDIEAESGTVISIEPAEELRRQIRRKNSTSITDPLEVFSGQPSSVVSVQNDTSVDVRDCRRSAGSTSFAPVVTQTQRIATDPTNNNYQHQHNRRHYRGGRRHQNHHHHHRERYENHSSSHLPQQSPQEQSAPSTNTGHSSKAGKQQKGQAACGASNR